jgi:hypothetical protein
MAKARTPALFVEDPEDKNDIQGGIINVSKELQAFSVDNLVGSNDMILVEPADVTRIVDKIGLICSVARSTALYGLCEMIRKGGANNNTPQTFAIEIYCPNEQVWGEIQKRDVLRAIRAVCPDLNFKNLADTLAPDIIYNNVAKTETHPSGDFSGDLAKKIGIRLAATNRPPLTPKERAGCASFARYVPNLNELTASERLTALLAEDLEIRRTSTRNKEISKKKNGAKKVAKKGEQPQKQ